MALLSMMAFLTACGVTPSDSAICMATESDREAHAGALLDDGGPVSQRIGERFKFVVMASLGAMGFGLTVTYGPEVEGALFPAVTDFEITRIEQAGPLYSRIWGTFDRPRAECNFAGLSWYLGTRERSSIAIVTFEEGAAVRPGGGTTFGPWLIQLTPEQVEQNSYAVALHQCHPLWMTRTEIHP